MEKSYDIVIIGSGFGGAITACRLAQAGRSVCILERGKRWGKGDFPRTTGQVSKSFWSPKKSYGFLEYRSFKQVDVIQAAGVGGGSLCYFNVHLRVPNEVIQRYKWPDAVNRNILDPYYDLVKDMLDAVPLTPPEGRRMPPKTEAFLTAAEKAGKKPKLVDIAVYTGPDRKSPHGSNIQSACVYSGNCLFGCHVHAKNTLDLNYIPLAEENGSQVYPLHQAFKIVPESDQGYRVHFRRLDDSEPGRGEEGSVLGKKVIVSAGSLGSTELLLQCRDVYKTLPQLSQQLGRRFSINGEMIFAGTMFTDREIDPGFGIPITAYADFSTPNNNIIIEDLGFPDPLVWFLEGAISTGGRLKRLAKLFKLYLLQSMGISKRSTRVSDEIDAITAGGLMTRFLPYLALGTDASDGVMSLRDGSIDIRWNHRGSRGMYRELEQALKDLSKGVNGQYTPSPLWQWPLRKLLVAHPLGGCIMGDSLQDSVVNHCGEVWNYPGLYVADGSVIPSALSVNPSMTIGSLAERTAFWILNNREMRSGDPESPKS